MKRMNLKYMPGQPETNETADQYQERIAPLIGSVAEALELCGDDFFDR